MFMIEHKILSEFRLKDKMVITLDSPRTADEFDTKKIIIGEKEYSYSITHNDLMLIIDTTESLINQKAKFVN
jgi:hypothetical protein